MPATTSTVATSSCRTAPSVIEGTSLETTSRWLSSAPSISSLFGILSLLDLSMINKHVPPYQCLLNDTCASRWSLGILLGWLVWLGRFKAWSFKGKCLNNFNSEGCI